MVTILNAAVPEGWRFRLVFAVRPLFAAKVVLERFDGIGWHAADQLASCPGAADRELAFRGLLADWGCRTSWTIEAVRYGKAVSIPAPPASSTEELCLKLDLASG